MSFITQAGVGNTVLYLKNIHFVIPWTTKTSLYEYIVDTFFRFQSRTGVKRIEKGNPKGAKGNSISGLEPNEGVYIILLSTGNMIPKYILITPKLKFVYDRVDFILRYLCNIFYLP